MKTIEKLQIPLKSQPLIQWRDDLKQDVNDLTYLTYQKSTFSQVTESDFIKKAQLIVMGKTFLTTQLSELLVLLNNEGVESVLLYRHS